MKHAIVVAVTQSGGDLGAITTAPFKIETSFRFVQDILEILPSNVLGNYLKKQKNV